MSTAPLAAGATLAPRYEVIEHLSRGRRLDVYDAWSEERGCRCIVKAVHPERAGEAEVRAALAREGDLLLHLAHPHIVRGYEALLEPRPMVVMETLTGQTLEHLLAESDVPLSSEEAAHLGLHLGSAIRYLHGHGALHLDLKPSNVVAERGLAKLIDLSVARPPGRCRPGVGTWAYMAPEQARGGAVGGSADVWGIGVVLFEAITGEPAFDDPGYEGASTSDDRETASGADDPPYPQLDGAAPSVEVHRDDVPVEMVDLIADCLHHLAARRPSILEVMARLEQLAGVPAAARRWR